MDNSASSPSPTPRKSRRRYWLIALSVLAVAAGTTFFLWSGRKKPVLVTTEPAIIKTITQLVSATGRIQPEIEVKIFAEVAGEIIELPVIEGQQVKPGALLARIRPDSYKAQVEQAQAVLANAKAVVLQMEAQAEKAGFDFKQVDVLFKRGLVSETDFSTGRSALRVAQANHEAALADLQRADGALRQAEDLLSKTAIYAPCDGTISILNSKLGLRPGFGFREVERKEPS